jgi:hypothetical protein
VQHALQQQAGRAGVAVLGRAHQFLDDGRYMLADLPGAGLAALGLPLSIAFQRPGFFFVIALSLLDQDCDAASTIEPLLNGDHGGPKKLASAGFLVWTIRQFDVSSIAFSSRSSSRPSARASPRSSAEMSA